MTTALLAAGCSVSEGVTEADPSIPATASPSPTTSASTTPATAATTTSTTTTTIPERCPDPLFPEPDAGAAPSPTRVGAGDPIAGSVALSSQVFACAEVAVVTSATDPDAVEAAAHLAAASRAPLLLGSPEGSTTLDAELRRLAPERVLRVGFGVRIAVPDGADIETLSPADITDTVLPELRAEVSTTTTTTEASEGGGEAGEEPPAAEEPGFPRAVVGTTAGDGESGRLWLIGDRDFALAAVAAAAAIAGGGLAVVVDAADLRAGRRVTEAVRSAPRPPSSVTIVGDVTEHAEWQVPILLEAPELPGGGLLLFPGRRLVAFYGSPRTPLLGVLGEQGPEAAADRLATITPPYGADGLEVLPAFEIIATVADSRAGSDGNYSNEMDLELLRPWIETAAERDHYVLLDLQPGRTDFLTQAKLYEEFLRLPHVGLALDPEWRLGPDELHLQQIGSVEAAEVNEVADWLAEIVRSEGLPQKVLLLHQFRFSMLQDRETIVRRPELATVIQMDGQGPIDSKYETWAAITAGTEGAGWWWGWKNFYDEDSPTPSPEQVLDLEPTAVYVSYQ